MKSVPVHMQQRALAFAIDSLVAFLPSGNLWVIGYAQPWPLVQMFACFLFGVLLLLRDTLFLDKSLGKRIMMYQVVRRDNSALGHSLGIGLLRNSSLLLFPVDVFVLLLTGQRIGDLWAGTKLVQQAYDFEELKELELSGTTNRLTSTLQYFQQQLQYSFHFMGFQDKAAKESGQGEVLTEGTNLHVNIRDHWTIAKAHSLNYDGATAISYPRQLLCQLWKCLTTSEPPLSFIQSLEERAHYKYVVKDKVRFPRRAASSVAAMKIKEDKGHTEEEQIDWIPLDAW